MKLSHKNRSRHAHRVADRLANRSQVMKDKLQNKFLDAALKLEKAWSEIGLLNGLDSSVFLTSQRLTNERLTGNSWLDKTGRCSEHDRD